MGRSRHPSSGSTLNDVAAAAGVSVITASRALRGQGPMSDSTRQKVLRAAEQTGYRRNPIAASLVSASSSLVGVIVPSLANIVFVDVLAGINATVADGGLRTIIGVSDYDLIEERNLVEAFLAWRPAALILTGLDHGTDTARMLQGSDTRCIELMDLGPDPIDLLIGFSHEDAGRRSAEHLWQRGYRRIGYVGHNLKRDTRAAKRYRAFRQALIATGADIQAEEIVPTASGVATGRRALAALLERAPRLDAVYFSNDDMAIGGMFHCLGAGIAVPEKLAVMGFNALEIGQEMPRPLTTIRTPRKILGERAGQLALDLARGIEVERITRIDFELVPGATA